MATIKEQREAWMRDHAIRETPLDEQLFLIRALLGLNPDQETVMGVQLLMQHGRKRFAALRGPRYDVLNKRFAEWAPMPGFPGEQLR